MQGGAVQEKDGKFGVRLASTLTWFALALMTGTTAAGAQISAPAVVSTRSYSGQFVIQAPVYSSVSRFSRELNTASGLVRLDPTVMPVSCERLKQLVWRELGAGGSWRGKIFVVLYPAGSPADLVGINAQKFNDGWQYRVEVPDLVDRTRYVRAMVQVLLIEIANRTAADRSAEIPTWLTEALTAQLLASSELEIILPPPKASPNGKVVGFTAVNTTQKELPLEAARVQLTTHPPLTFDQLSWPGASQLSGEAGQVYRRSAQLFLNELLRLENGRGCLLQMITELPTYYNWQFAFLRAFGKSFQSALEVEKWWAVHVVQFTGRDLAQRWSAGETWGKLDECLRLRVQVHADSNSLPSRSEMPLKSVVQNWNDEGQALALSQTLKELELIRMRAASEAVGLVDEYSATLQRYLRERENAGLPFGLRQNAARRHLAQQTIRQLELLDARRASLEQSSNATPNLISAGTTAPPVAP